MKVSQGIESRGREHPNLYSGSALIALKLVHRHSTLKQTQQVKNPNWQEINQFAMTDTWLQQAISEWAYKWSLRFNMDR